MPRFGVQFDDQGLVNTDPRFIAVPDGYINLIPTDVRGLTFNRSPQMVRAPMRTRGLSCAPHHTKAEASTEYHCSHCAYAA